MSAVTLNDFVRCQLTLVAYIHSSNKDMAHQCTKFSRKPRTQPIATNWSGSV